MLTFQKKEEQEPILYQEYLEKEQQNSAEDRHDEEDETGKGVGHHIRKLLPFAAVGLVLALLGVTIFTGAGTSQNSENVRVMLASSTPNVGRADVGLLMRTDGIEKETATIETTETVAEIVNPAELQGKDGSDGRDGENGLNGEDGQDGENGLDGEDGQDGEDGSDGEDGEDGSDGEAGKNGEDGKNGLDGEKGKDGLNGADGQDGKSAFALAQEGGYAGTENQLMSTLSTLDTNLGGMRTDIDDTNTSVDILSGTVTVLDSQVEQCFGLVSSGKELLASTLTDKGVDTEDATFGTINNGILELYIKAFASGADSVSGAAADIAYTYHYHEGGCYDTCPGTLKHYDTVEHSNGVKDKYFRCDVCGRTWCTAGQNDYADRPCGLKTVICGMVDGQILSAIIEFNK